MEHQQVILVTVGSTSFPKLTDFMTRPSTYDAISSTSASTSTKLCIQHGRHKPQPPQPDQLHRQTIELFDYAPTLKPWMDKATLVISHAGAGTILEVIDNQIPLIVVINSDLMDNHQTELAYAMEKLSCCKVVDQSQIETHLISCIQTMLATSQNQKKSGDSMPKAPKRISGLFSKIVTQELNHTIQS